MGALAARREPATALGLAVAAAVLGACYAVSAWWIHPLALPGGLGLAALAAVTLRRPEVGIAAAFLLVPLSNLGLTGQPPWLLTTAWAAFLAGLALWKATNAAESPHGLHMPPLALPIAAILVVAIVAFVLGGTDPEGYSELRSLATGMLYFTAIALLVRSERQVVWCLGGIGACLTLVGGLALRDRLSGTSSQEAFFTPDGALIGRVAAGFGHPNELGGFLVILVPFALAGLVLSRRLRPLFAAAVLLAAIGIYASFSRGALVALAVIPFVFLRGRKLLVVTPVLAILLLIATPGLVRERFATLTQSGSEISTRVEFWSTAISIWSDQPILGAGLGRFPTAYAEARVPGRGFLPGTVSKPPPHAHNLFAQELATKGLVGLLALLAVLGRAVSLTIGLRRQANPLAQTIGSAALASLAAFLVHNQFDVTLLEGTGIYFWALLGILAAVTAHVSTEPSP